MPKTSRASTKSGFSHMKSAMACSISFFVVAGSDITHPPLWCRVPLGSVNIDHCRRQDSRPEGALPPSIFQCIISGLFFKRIPPGQAFSRRTEFLDTCAAKRRECRQRSPPMSDVEGKKYRLAVCVPQGPVLVQYISDREGISAGRRDTSWWGGPGTPRGRSFPRSGGRVCRSGGAP